MTNVKLTQLIEELEAELSAVNEEITEYIAENPEGVDASGSGNFDDAFEWGREEGEMYERRRVLSNVIKRLKETI